MAKRIQQSRVDLSQTPQRFWAFFALIAVTTALTWVIFLSGIGYARSQVQTITKDSVPSIVAAQEIRKGLFKMDGDTVANYLRLTHGGKADYDINQDRMLLSKQLVLAAQNITYGEAESIPIGNMVGRLPMYSELTSPALEGQGNWRAKRLLMASDLLHDELVKSANELDRVNRDHLKVAFEDSQSGLRTRSVLTIALGVVLLGVMAFVQFKLTKLTHRWINIPLATATLIAVVIVGSNIKMMSEETENLRAAKLDSFDSVGYLSEAEAASADARAKALYSLVPEGKEKSWADCQVELDNLAASSSTEELERTYTSQVTPTFKGLLGNELRNITFNGEIEAANAELHIFAAMKQTFLALKNNPSNEDAIVQAFRPSSSVDEIYSEADKAIEITKQINVREFEKDRDKAFDSLSFPSLSLNLLSLAVIVLAYFGIRKRVAEYGD
jgi:hypothetical protein